MSLPFLKKKQVAGLIMAKRQPDGSKMETGPEPEEKEEVTSLNSAASDLLAAIEAKDVTGIASALHAAFEIADSMPHSEGEHLNEDEE